MHEHKGIDLIETIAAARGRKPADLLLANARIVNVFGGDIQAGAVAIADGMIVGIGGDHPARTVRDMKGRYVAPGLIDAHVHIESAMAGVGEFARALAARGTTTVVADPHEIANVLGVAGIRYMLDSAESQPINIYVTLPSCVPATDHETAGARLRAEDLRSFWRHPRVVGLAEMMNIPGVLNADPDVMAKIRDARRFGKPVDGHAPGLGGSDLQAYAAAGIGSDHECTTAQEALEKMRVGMHIMIREGTGAKNLTALLPIVTPNAARQCMWCTDDRHPHDILQEGHIDAILRQASAAGLDPITAIQLATINPARYFGLHHLGAVAPGRQADLVVFSDPAAPEIEAVYHRGVLTVENGRMLDAVAPAAAPCVPSCMKLDPAAVDFSVGIRGDRVHVIDIVPDQIVTERSVQPILAERGKAVADPSRDLLKIAVVDRHSGTGRHAVGFVHGFGLKRGAMASSVAHDSHNVVVAGASDHDMRTALAGVVARGGGLVVAADGKMSAELPLPIAGLMSDLPLESIADRLSQLGWVARELGCRLNDPFMTLSFLALPVIPRLKITDRGLVDVGKFKLIDLFV